MAGLVIGFVVAVCCGCAIHRRLRARGWCAGNRGSFRAYHRPSTAAESDSDHDNIPSADQKLVLQSSRQVKALASSQRSASQPRRSIRNSLPRRERQSYTLRRPGRQERQMHLTALDSGYTHANPLEEDDDGGSPMRRPDEEEDSPFHKVSADFDARGRATYGRAWDEGSGGSGMPLRSVFALREAEVAALTRAARLQLGEEDEGVAMEAGGRSGERRISRDASIDGSGRRALAAAAVSHHDGQGDSGSDSDWVIPVAEAVREAGETRRGRQRPDLRLATPGAALEEPRRAHRLPRRSHATRQPPPASAVPGAFRH